MKTSIRHFAVAGLMLCALPTLSQPSASLLDGFTQPPHEARPRVWWHWMNGNISREGIYKDLTWMHRVGIAGFHLFDAGLSTPQIVPKRITYMTPEWKDCFRYALHLADSLGMSVAIPSSPGWSNTGGPWVKPENAMKKLTWRTLRLKGGQKICEPLPDLFTTTGIFQNVAKADIDRFVCAKDVAVVAVRLPEADRDLRDLQATVQASNGTPTVKMLTDGDLNQSVRIGPDTDGRLYVQYRFDRPQQIKALSIADGRWRSTWNSWSAPVLYHLESSADGTHFTRVCDIPQSGAPQQTIDIPPTTAQYFRVVCDEPEADKTGTFFNLSELVLYTTGRIHFAEERAGFTSFGDLDLFPIPSVTDLPTVDDVVVLTDHVDADGRLQWEAPPGNWMVYRFGWSLTGKKNGPASPEATGLEVDKMDAVAVRDFFEHYLAMYHDASGGAIGDHGVRYLLIDSYEAGNQTWTPGLPHEFERRRGYSLYRWLPVLVGQPIGSVAQSEQFLYDWRQTIGELLEENLYGVAAEVAREHKLGTYFESHENGRQLLADGIAIKSRADIPMGAMWAEKRADLSMYECDIRETASAAHIYGKRMVAGEAFTADGRKETCYTFYPGNLKPIADYLMGCGLNRFVIHESAHQPVDDKRPGLALAIYGQWFNRHETWAEYAKVWTDYLARSSYMLQQGDYVADVAYYYGGDNSVNGRFGHNHPKVPRQYSFDYVNPQSLIQEFSFDGTNLVTRAGMKYRLLVIDPQVTHVTVPELRKLAELARAGAPICGNRPTVQPNLMGDDAEWQRLVAEIWDAGRPHVITGKTVAEALDMLGVAPDFCYNQQDSIRWIHRRTADADIYWVANARDEALHTAFSLRVSGKRPELWNAEDGTVRPVGYAIADGRTTVHVDMKPYDAFFLVFRDEATAASYTPAVEQELPVLTLDTDWTVRFQEGMGAPSGAVPMPRLQSYTEIDDEAIRYFSGTATYEKTFSLPAKIDKRSRYVLDLGAVGCMAEVTLNGQQLGTLWKQPYTIDLTPALRKKNNRLQVKVVNLWVNRVIGDKQPGVKQKYTWASYNGAFRATSPLHPSGLMGPVRLVQVAPR